MFRYEPIAAKIRGLVDVAGLTSPGVIEEAQRGVLEGSNDDRHIAITPELAEFMAHYFTLMHAALGLLDLSPFARLADRYLEAKEAYMPGGPPMSPIYDSFFHQHG